MNFWAIQQPAPTPSEVLEFSTDDVVREWLRGLALDGIFGEHFRGLGIDGLTLLKYLQPEDVDTAQIPGATALHHRKLFGELAALRSATAEVCIHAERCFML